MFDVDDLKIYRGSDIHITDKIIVIQPTIDQIIEFGEKRYFQTVHCLTFQGGAGHDVAPLGTEAQLELLYDVVAETTLTEIGKTTGATVHGVVHLVLEPLQRPFVQDEHALPLRLRGTFLGGQFPFLHLNAVFLGQIAKRIGIGQLLVLHDAPIPI